MDDRGDPTRMSFVRESDEAAADGTFEFDGVLFRGDPEELTVQVYASDERAALDMFVPVWERLLPHLDEMIAGLGPIDADLAQVILYGGKLGLHFWSRGVNDEFTAIYLPHGGVWRFDAFGDIFA